MREGTLRPTPWPSVRRRLDQACGAAGGQLLTPDDAKTFIREYMRALFTGRRASDPDRFVRTFVAALSFTDIPSVEQFVHRYLLEPDLIDIADLRESIRRYREIQKTISDLNRRLDALRAIQVQIDTFDHFLAQELVCRGIEKTALLVEGLGGLLANLADRRAKSSELEHVQTELKRVEDEIAAEQEALSSVQRQLLASGAQGQCHGGTGHQGPGTRACLGHGQVAAAPSWCGAGHAAARVQGPAQCRQSRRIDQGA
jgi:prefoldin subunit 5